MASVIICANGCKAKLAGKLGAESENGKRLKLVLKWRERAKSEMQTKVEPDTGPSIIDRASSTGKLRVTNTKLCAIQLRLVGIDCANVCTKRKITTKRNTIKPPLLPSKTLHEKMCIKFSFLDHLSLPINSEH